MPKGRTVVLDFIRFNKIGSITERRPDDIKDSFKLLGSIFTKTWKRKDRKADMSNLMLLLPTENHIQGNVYYCDSF